MKYWKSQQKFSLWSSDDGYFAGVFSVFYFSIKYLFMMVKYVSDWIYPEFRLFLQMKLYFGADAVEFFLLSLFQLFKIIFQRWESYQWMYICSNCNVVHQQSLDLMRMKRKSAITIMYPQKWSGNNQCHGPLAADCWCHPSVRVAEELNEIPHGSNNLTECTWRIFASMSEWCIPIREMNLIIENSTVNPRGVSGSSKSRKKSRSGV